MGLWFRCPELERAIRRCAREGNVYCRLLVAAADGKGVRLTYDDVFNLATMDDAVETAAEAYAERKHPEMVEDIVTRS